MSSAFTTFVGLPVLIFVGLLVSIPGGAVTGPQTLSLGGQLLAADETPIHQANVDFTVEVLDASATCVLYREKHLAEDLSVTPGRFNLIVGQGTSRVNNLDASTALDAAVFLNAGTVPVANCAQPTVALNAGDGRQVRISYDLGSGAIAMSPNVPLVSSAFALVADSVQGKGAADLIQVNTSGSTALTQANEEYAFSTVNWPRLKALLDGTSSQYLETSPSTAVDFNGQRLVNVADPTAAQNAATKNYADTRLAGQPLDVSAVGPMTGNGSVLRWDSTANKWVASAISTSATGTAGGDLSGSYPSPIIRDDAITARKIASANRGTNRLLISDASTGDGIGYGVCTLNQVYAWTAGGWACTNVATLAPVTSVAGYTGAVTLMASDIGGVKSAALLDYGTAAGQLAPLDGSARLPAVDGSQLTNVNAAQLQTRPVAATAPTSGQVLGWNGSTWLPVASSSGSVTSMTGGTGLNGGVITSTGTLSVDVGSAAGKIVQENASAQIAQTSGTATGPAYTFSGNTSTGVYSPGANQLAIATNGTAALSVLANGFVGVGTSAPTALLHVERSPAASGAGAGIKLVAQSTTAFSAVPGDIALLAGDRSGAGGPGGNVTITSGNSNSGPGNITLQGPTGPGFSGGNINLLASSNANGDGGAINLTAGSGTGAVNGGAVNITSGAGGGGYGGDINLTGGNGVNTHGANVTIRAGNGVAAANANGGNVVLIPGTSATGSPGNVGVNTLTPQAGFDIATTGTISSAVIVPRDSTANRPVAAVNGMIRYNSTLNQMEGYINGAWSNLGGTAASGVSTFGDGSVSAPGLALASDLSTGFYRYGIGDVAFSSGGTRTMSFTGAGLRTLAGQISGTNTAANPTFANVNDTPTGMSFPATSTIGFSTAATERLRIDANGNVGIGTSVPFYKLEVAGSGDQKVKINSTTATAALQLQSTGFTNSPVVELQLVPSNAATANYARFNYIGGTDRANLLVLRADGNIGIGTTAPQSGLDIATTGTIASALIVPRDTTAMRPTNAVNGMIRYNSATSKFEAFENNAWTNLIGGAQPSFPLLANPIGTASAPAYSFSGNANTGLFSPGANQVAIATNGTAALTVQASGNVGIGTTTGSDLLTLYTNGTANILTQNAANGNAQIYQAANGGTAGYNSVSIGGSTYYNQRVAGPGYSSVANNNRLGIYQADGFDGSSFLPGSVILTEVDAVPSVGNLKARLVFQTSGGSGLVERMRITSAGDIGIGTSAPATDIPSPGITVQNVGFFSSARTGSVGYQMYNNGAVTEWLTYQPAHAVDDNYHVASLVSGGVSDRFVVGVNGSWRSTAPSQGDVSLTHASNVSTMKGATSVQLALGANGTEALRISNLGTIGIGTAAPAAGLDIATTGTIASAMIVPRDSTANRPTVAVNGMIRYNSATSKFEAFENNTWSNMIGGGSPSFPLLANPIGSASAPAYSFSGNPNTGMYSPAVNQLSFASNGTAALTITANGNVGIGTATPGATLAAIGTAINGILFSGGASGAAPTIGNFGADTAGVGLGLSLVGKSATATGAGGGLSLLGGDANTTGQGGPITLTAGKNIGATGSSTSVSITGSDSITNSFAAGGVTITGGGGGAATNVTGGALTLRGGTGGSGGSAGGAVTLAGGNAGGNNTGGAVNILAGSSNTGTPAHVNITAGSNQAGSQPAGNLNLSAGATTNTIGNGGKVIITAGSGGSASGSGGDILLIPGSVTSGISGNVGINTTTPASGLDVALTGTVGSAIIVPRDSTANRPTVAVNGMIRYNNATSKFEAFENAAWTNMIGGAQPSFPLLANPIGTAAAPAYSFSGSANTGMYSPAANQLALSANGTSALNILANGSVGIGSTTPTAKLDVSGIVNASAQYKIGGVNAVAIPTSGSTVIGDSLAATGTGGSENTAVGSVALAGLTSGGQNTAVGRLALTNVTSGGSNTAVGWNAGRGIFTNSSNTAIGWQALNNGSNSTAVGSWALTNSSTGTRNMAIGSSSQYSLQTGGQNISMGFYSLFNNSSGSFNIALGDGALQSATASSNVAVGNSAGYTISTGTNNLALGTSVASTTLTTGSNNILIGTSGAVDTPAAATSNFLNVGNTLYGNLSTKQIGIGTATPAAGLDLATTGTIASALIVPRDSTAMRPTVAVNGMLRYNTATSKFEAFENNAWTNMIGGGSASFPLLANPIGSAAAPAYSFNGNANTGMYSPAANQISFATNGTSAINISAAGYVGIGTTTASAPLTVSNNTSTAFMKVTPGFSSGAGTWIDLDTGGPSGIGTGGPGNNAWIGYVNAGNNYFAGSSVGDVVYRNTGGRLLLGTSNGGVPDMTVFGGRVGIGTTGAQAGLDIATTGTIASAIIVPRDSTAMRPTVAVNGMLRYNTNLNAMESYINGGWQTLAAQTSGGAGFLPLNGGTMTGAIVQSNGTVAAPSLSFANDLTTGLYSTGAGIMNFATAGNARLSILANGAVGVGLTSPAAVMHVARGYGGAPAIAGNRALIIQDDAGAGDTLNVDLLGGPTGNASLNFGSRSAVAKGQVLYNNAINSMSLVTNGTQKLVITTDGNVGIGAATPAAGLDVATTGTIASAIIVPRDTTGNRPTVAMNGMIRYNSATSKFEAYENAAWTNMIGGGSGSFPLLANPIGSAAAPAYSFSGNANTGMYSPAANQVAIATNGTAALTVLTNGFMGIGTTAPASRLHVPWLSGDAVSSATFGSNSSSNNQVAIVANSYLTDAIQGVSNSSSGVNGFSNVSSGVYGFSNSYVGVLGRSSTGISGQFITNNPANTSPTLVVQALGAQPGNLQEWVDTSANRLMVVTSAGFVGIGTANPKAAFDVANTGTIASAIIVPRDSTANRPTVAVNGMIRYNSATSKFEAYENAVWTNMIGGGSGSFPLLANPIGTAAAPAYSFSGNANTGMYSPAVNQLSLASNGTAALTISASGSVGVGTTVPAGTIDIGGANTVYTAGTPSALRFSNTSATGQSLIDFYAAGAQQSRIRADASGNLSYVTYGGAHTFYVGGDYAAGKSPIAITASGGVGIGYNTAPGALTGSTIAVLPNGNVGINTTAPGSGLDVALTGTVASAIIVPRDSTAMRPTVAVNGMIRYNNATSKFEAFENNTWTNMIGGSVPSFPLLANPIGSAATPAYSFSGSANTGMYSPGANQVAIAANGTAALSVLASGSVGIGSTAPVATLDVNGGLRAGTTAVVTATCNATIEGTQRYNTTTHAMEFCNGTAWITVGSSANAMSLVSTLTASSSASLAWTNLGGRTNFKMICYNLVASASSNLYAQFGEGGTPTWQTSGYSWARWAVTAASSSGGGATSDNGISVQDAFNTNAIGTDLSFMLYGTNTSGNMKKISGEAAAYDSSNFTNRTFSGVYTADTNPITAIRLIPSTGTIASGTCSLYSIGN